MKITLQVDGREMTFSEEEVIAILKEHLTLAKPKRPTEEAPFVVDPSEIDRSFFQEERKDERQEKTRQLILEAFAMVDKYPEKYRKCFMTLIPKKSWTGSKTVDKLRELATVLGDHMADLVEQTLEWAQRIQNGEGWYTVCNKADTADWYRLIEWNKSHTKRVGGSKVLHDSNPASYLDGGFSYNGLKIYNTVPLVVLY